MFDIIRSGLLEQNVLERMFGYNFVSFQITTFMLKSIKTETFGDLSCNFYRNMNDDILLTREQIEQALEYADPIKAIQKIYLKHQDRLEPFIYEN